MARGFLTRSTVGLGACVFLLSASPAAFAQPSSDVAPALDVITFKDGQVTGRTSTPLNLVREPAAAARIKPALTAAPAGKISPNLSRLLSAETVSSRDVPVLVTFFDDQKLPDLPELDADQPVSAVANQAVLDSTDTMISELTARREPGYQQIRADFAQFGGRVLNTHWLIKGLQAEVPLSSIAAIAQRPDVSYVEPADTEVVPTSVGDGNPGNDLSVARALMGTDAYYNLGHVNERIGILDTGVRLPHTLLNSWSISRYDVTTSHNPDDDCWNHGTKTAGVLTSNSNLGNAFRGITNEYVDSIKVFRSGTKADGKCRSSTPDYVVAGFERATQLRDTVIVTALGSSESEDGQIAVAADAAFSAGAAVIAANGNDGGGFGTVDTPAVARKVIGVGAVDVETFAMTSDQSWGPTGDGRFKPDIVTPTRMETASGLSSSALHTFSGTSGASANAGGAAAALRSFLRGQGNTLLPGHVYAGMILSGGNPTHFDNLQGAGKLKLPNGGAYYHPTIPLAVHGGETVNFVLPITATGCRLSAALWWPEAAGAHNDVDLYLLDPHQNMVASSNNSAGVFESVRVNGPIMGGNWTLQVVGGNVTGVQNVYVAAATCR